MLRSSSAVGSAIAFGLLAHPLLPVHWFAAAVVLAFCFGFVFLAGTGYRILAAVASRSARSSTSASWTGATLAVSLVVLLVAAATSATGAGGAQLLLAAYAIAINAAYLPVKIACIDAGCCAAVRPLPWPAGARLDLRGAEVLLTTATLLISSAQYAAGSQLAAAAAGIGGHAAVRLLSRVCRGRMTWPVRVFDRGCLEFSILVVLFAFVVLLTIKTD